MILSKKVLVIGKPGDQDSVEPFLEEWGFPYRLAPTPKKALDALDKESYIMAIFRCQSDTSPGPHQIKDLKTLASRLPTVWWHATADVMTRAYEYGVKDVWCGELPRTILVSKLKNCLETYTQIATLEKEKDHLLEVNRRMQKFVGNVAHDLRGPLGKLINIGEVLLAGVDAEALDTFYKIIAKTSQRGFELVKDLLDITALEQGHIKIETEKSDLAVVAQQVVTEQNYLAERKNIHLVNSISVPAPVTMDGPRIIQVLVNLVGNAIKFTPKSGTVTLSAHKQGSGLRIKVIDTGVGMSPEAVDDLFLKHRKRSTPGTEGERGTGFGLVLAQEIIKAHGSEIQVESELGRGSCFSFVLAK